MRTVIWYIILKWLHFVADKSENLWKFEYSNEKTVQVVSAETKCVTTVPSLLYMVRLISICSPCEELSRVLNATRSCSNTLWAKDGARGPFTAAEPSQRDTAVFEQTNGVGRQLQSLDTSSCIWVYWHVMTGQPVCMFALIAAHTEVLSFTIGTPSSKFKHPKTISALLGIEFKKKSKKKLWG